MIIYLRTIKKKINILFILVRYEKVIEIDCIAFFLMNIYRIIELDVKDCMVIYGSSDFKFIRFLFLI